MILHAVQHTLRHDVLGLDVLTEPVEDVQLLAVGVGHLEHGVILIGGHHAGDGADPVVALVRHKQLAVRTDSDGADGGEPRVGGQVRVGVPALAAGVQTVAIGVLARNCLNLSVTADLPDPVDPLRVALGDVELPVAEKVMDWGWLRAAL